MDIQIHCAIACSNDSPEREGGLTNHHLSGFPGTIGFLIGCTELPTNIHSMEAALRRHLAAVEVSDDSYVSHVASIAN